MGTAIQKLPLFVILMGFGALAMLVPASHALVVHDEELRPAMREKGMMTRDPRQVERKKPGRPKARKRFQFSKR